MAQPLTTTSAQETVRPAPTDGASFTQQNEDCSKFDGASIGLARSIKPIGIFAAAVVSSTDNSSSPDTLNKGKLSLSLSRKLTHVGILSVTAALAMGLTTEAKAQTAVYNTLPGFSTGVNDASSSMSLFGGSYSITYQPVHLNQSGDLINQLEIIGIFGTKDSGVFVQSDPNLSTYTANIFSSMDAAKANPFQGDVGQMTNVTFGDYGPAFGHEYTTFTFNSAQPIQVGNDFVVSVFSTDIPFKGSLSWSLTGDASAEKAVFLSSGAQNGFVFPQGATLKIGAAPPAVPEFGTDVGLAAGIAILGGMATIKHFGEKIAHRK